MEHSKKTAREMFTALMSDARRPRYGLGLRPMLINVDLQKAYTLPAEYPTAYAGHPDQMKFVNALASAFRRKSLPVAWSYVAFSERGDDCGVFGQRADHVEALKGIGRNSRRSELDDRLVVDPNHDTVYNKLMPSAFHETPLQSLMVFHRCDTLIVTGGSTSGCVRATVVDGLSRGYQVVVARECVADRHESPHFANLYDMEIKYASVRPVREIMEHIESL